MPSFFLQLLLRGVLLVALLLFSGCALFESTGSNLSSFHTVILDAGHGGYDHGAKAVRGKDEKFLTLDTAERLRTLLQNKRYCVVMTRSSDTFIPLGTRTTISNAYSDAIFISIHFNSSPHHSASGIETYYYNPASQPLAATIFRRLPSAYHAQHRGVKKATYYVLHHNRRPSRLLELGFLSNRSENNIVQNPTTRQHLAEQIAQGIASLHQ